jgi:hypothetical protein
MIYEIIAEAHCGVAECDEIVLGHVEEYSPDAALREYARFTNDLLKIHWSDEWGCYLVGNSSRKAFARHVK